QAEAVLDLPFDPQPGDAFRLRARPEPGREKQSRQSNDARRTHDVTTPIAAPAKPCGGGGTIAGRASLTSGGAEPPGGRTRTTFAPAGASGRARPAPGPPR